MSHGRAHTRRSASAAASRPFWRGTLLVAVRADMSHAVAAINTANAQHVAYMRAARCVIASGFLYLRLSSHVPYITEYPAIQPSPNMGGQNGVSTNRNTIKAPRRCAVVLSPDSLSHRR